MSESGASSHDGPGLRSGPHSGPRLGSRSGGGIAAVVAWLFSIGLIVAAAALTAWGLKSLASLRPVFIPIEREKSVIDFGGAAPSTSPSSAGSEAPGDQDLLLVVQDPAWTRPPRPEFPQDSLEAGVIQGTVVLACKTDVKGRLEDCVIHAETPAGAGFGDAALAAARDARVSPRQVDGKPTAGTVAYVTRFHSD